jgi:hypothetical protein
MMEGEQQHLISWPAHDQQQLAVLTRLAALHYCLLTTAVSHLRVHSPSTERKCQTCKSQSPGQSVLLQESDTS